MTTALLTMNDGDCCSRLIAMSEGKARARQVIFTNTSAEMTQLQTFASGSRPANSGRPFMSSAGRCRAEPGAVCEARLSRMRARRFSSW